MSDRREMLYFSLTFATLSVVFGWLFWNVSIPLGEGATYRLSEAIWVAPIIATMLAARGFSLKRKTVYAGALSMGFPLIMIVAELAGVHAYVNSQFSTNQHLPSLGAGLYMALIRTAPLAMLILFAGKTPWLIWRKETPARRNKRN